MQSAKRFLFLAAALLCAAFPASAQVVRTTTGSTSSPTLIPRQIYADTTHGFFYVGDPVTGSPLNVGFVYSLTTQGDILIAGASGVPSRLAIGASGKIITSNGTTAVWADPATSGTVTSIALTVPTGFSVSGSPITSSGTLGITSSLSGIIKGNGSNTFTGSAALGDLSNVTLTTPASGDFLKYNGSAWVNGPGASISGLTGQVGYFTGTDVLGGDGRFLFDDATNRLSVIASGETLTPNVTGFFADHSTTIGGSAGTIGSYDTSSFAQGVGGGIVFGGKYDSSDDYALFGGIQVRKATATDGDDTGEMAFSVRPAGGPTQTRLVLSGDGDLSFNPATGAFGLRLGNVASSSVTGPAAGALIYDSGALKYYDATIPGWTTIGSAGGGGGAPTGSAGGDLSGSYPNPTVAKVNGNSVPSGIATGNLLYGSGANTLSKLAIGSSGDVLQVVGGIPAWGTLSGYLLASNNLSDVTASTARTNLGLGTSAVKDIPASGNASSSQVVYGTDTRVVNGHIDATFDGGGSVLAVGSKWAVRCPYAGTITGWVLGADQSGSVTVDIWKDTTRAGTTVADSLTAAAKPALSSAQENSSTSLTGWTTSVTAGDWIVFNIDAATTITTLQIRLDISKN